MGRKPASTRKRRVVSAPKKLKLTANSETQVAKPKLPIDFKEGEIAFSKKPKRPPGWKPKKIFKDLFAKIDA